jgi:hypothetical protein
MMDGKVYAAASVVIVIGILAFAFSMGSLSGLTSGGQNSTSSSSTIGNTSSIQGANQTVVAIHVTALASTTSTSTSSASTTSSQSQSTGGSYSYNPSSQVSVLSVAATVSGTQAGQETVSFSVQFQNVGSGTIDVLSGGGSSLSATITPGQSVIQQTTGPKCEIAVAMVPVSHGGVWTARTPGCWSGYYYQLVVPGTIQVQLTLNWSGNSSQGSSAGSMMIDAQFTLA